ncbi:hypothetical protein DH2020_024875 [Rehmannia glutinosa]|uniref:Uncharacterized protein n=1 Tax=Rehmannia glutinosa TaxID=99300 RepID=A0ABR0W334_REHGL
MSVFKLPVGICQDLCRMASCFWWGVNGDGINKIHWASWDKLSRTKMRGGLGFKNFQDFNSALLAKQLWRVITQPNLLMSRIIKAKYFPRIPIFSAVAKPTDSWLWKGWISSLPTLLLGARFQVGDGKSIRIWESPWIPKVPSFKPVRIGNVGADLVWIRELLNEEGNAWNHSLVSAVFSHDDAKCILAIPICSTGSKDRIFWHFDKKGFVFS